jgi:CHAT domain-containing protein
MSSLRTVSITRIDGRIATIQKSLSLLHRSHPECIKHVQILAVARFTRYALSHQKKDLDNSILHFTEAILLPPMLRAGPFLNVVRTLHDLAFALLERSEEFEQPEDISFSIEYLRHLRGFPSDSFDVPRIGVTTSLIRALRTQVRLGAGNATQDINEMVVLFIELLSSSKSTVIPSAAFDDLIEAVSIEFDRGLTTEMIDKVVECFRGAVKAYPPDSNDVWHQAMYALAYTLNLRFMRTHSKKDCEEADALLEKILEPGGCPDSFRVKASKLSAALAVLRSGFFKEPEYSEVAIACLRAESTSPSLDEGYRAILTTSLATETRRRFEEFFHDDSREEANSYISQLVNASSSSSLIEPANLSWPEEVRENGHEAIRLMSSVINDQYACEPDRFRLSCRWANIARSIGHSTTLTAYKTSMSLMQKSLSFAPTVSTQHSRLVSMGENCQTMPLDYASYQTHLGQFEEAVETLEQGRALLWSEMHGLRTPVFQLIGEDSPFAKKFANINQELEALTVSVTPSGMPEVEDGVYQGKGVTDAFGRLVIKRTKLVEERDALISQIRSRPGLEGFLRAPSYTTLRSAASCGPIVIVNHCKWRSDIIIIFHNYLPCLIPTDETFFARANELRDDLVKAQKCGLDSKEYQDALCSVLKALYELVGEPVIKRLQVLGVPEQSRIWWCPTSVFCSLPLHAMGPIPSTEPGKPRYFSDLYIPSYTPSLSTLIESRKASPHTLVKPSLLLVAQPDDSLPGVTGEIQVILERAIKARVAVTGLVSNRATPPIVLEGLRSSRLAHFACHGVLETGKPFEASFKLHGGSRLTLLEIVQSRLPGAEFAFLSCCHAAEITAKSVSDEALHLTAAMQYCGFRSVVGTMWAMADTDGRDLAKNFYKSLFSRRDSSVRYYERSAEALRDATQKLREKRGITLERWVNFVHYGA